MDQLRPLSFENYSIDSLEFSEDNNNISSKIKGGLSPIARKQLFPSDSHTPSCDASNIISTSTPVAMPSQGGSPSNQKHQKVNQKNSKDSEANGAACSSKATSLSSAAPSETSNSPYTRTLSSRNDNVHGDDFPNTLSSSFQVNSTYEASVRTTGSDSVASDSDGVMELVAGRGTTSCLKEVPLTPRQKWIIEKTRAEREKRKLKHKQEAMEAQLKALKIENDAKRRQRAKESHTQWLKMKQVQDLTRKQEAREKQARERSEEEKKKQAAEQRRCDAYHHWCKKKDEEKRKQEFLRLQEQKNKEKLLKQRQEQSEEAYRNWLYSLGYRSGRVWWRNGGDLITNPDSWIGPLDQEWDPLNTTITK